MITVQINTPNARNTSNKLKNLIFNPRPNIKPSKSSLDLSAQDYDRYFTLNGKSTSAKIKDNLKRVTPPNFDYKIVIACFIWYASSAVSSNITKEILKNFKHPTTLTEIQFLISSFLCCFTIVVMNNKRSMIDMFPKGTLPSLKKFHDSRTSLKLIEPSWKIVKTTLPMGIFQFVGHITSHQATSVIPVSIVHSVKALSPLSTVLAYRVFYKVKYSNITYLTLIPLMVGVIMTCFSSTKQNSKNINFNKGLVFAFISMIIFVSQNIFAKKILTVAPSDNLPKSNKEEVKEDEKLDKITVLLYCSMFGFILTLPVYLINELTNESFTLFEINFYILTLFLLHGITHFCQAMFAFHLIGSISPVNYSIANILKRIVVISMAIIWERESINMNQGFGLVLTMIGLYSYDKWGMVKK